MYKCKNISAIETYPLRHLVLRAGKPIETCAFDGDHLASTLHFGCFDGDNLIGVVSVFDNNSAAFSAQNQFQLRGMAVLDDYQKKGIGRLLVHFAEDYIKTQNSNLIWFNARIIAVAFYEKLGYQKIGNSFDIGDIGAHFVMFKEV